MARNEWTASIGIDGRHGPDYALNEHDMVIVTNADRLFGDFGGDAWEKERAIIDIVGKFVNSLPSE